MLEPLEPHTARVTLGVDCAPNGNQTLEKEHLRKKAEIFADNYRMTKGLDKNEAWEGILTTVMATMKYPTAATQLTEADWDYVLSPVCAAGLPKSWHRQKLSHMMFCMDQFCFKYLESCTYLITKNWNT